MPAVKCENCGTMIPEDAVFCPECGASKSTPQKPAQTEPKPTQQAQPQPAQPEPKPTQQAQPQPVQPIAQKGPGAQVTMSNLAETVFSKFMIMLGICIGILLVWIGVILRNFAGGVGSTINGILSPTAFAGIGLLIFGGGFLNKDFDKFVRMGMVIIGGLIIVIGIAGMNLRI